jgi:HD domain
LINDSNVASSGVAGLTIPDSQLARNATQFVRDTENDLLFFHSTRVYFWGGLRGQQTGLNFDPELLYVAAMFHDIGLTKNYQKSQLRFEVDGANAALEFLGSHAISEKDISTVWTAIALHTTPGIPEFMGPEVALLQVGAGMDIAGRGYETFTDQQRQAVVAAYPRGKDFGNKVIDAFYQGMKHRPASTFGTFNDDFLADKDPTFQRVNICSVIRGSHWEHAHHEH